MRTPIEAAIDKATGLTAEEALEARATADRRKRQVRIVSELLAACSAWRRKPRANRVRMQKAIDAVHAMDAEVAALRKEPRK